MARTLTSAQDTQVDAAVVQPWLLVKLDFSTPLYLTNADENISWNSQTWSVSGITVSGLHPSKIGGGQRVQITLPDTANAYFDIIRSEGVDDKQALIYAVHGAPGTAFAVDDAEQLFDGVMDAVPNMGERVTITLASTGTRQMYTPRHYVQPPLFNHLPVPGERIFWNGVWFVAERAPG